MPRIVIDYTKDGEQRSYTADSALHGVEKLSTRSREFGLQSADGDVNELKISFAFDEIPLLLDPKHNEIHATVYDATGIVDGTRIKVEEVTSDGGLGLASGGYVGSVV